MLVLSRRPEEEINIGEDISIKVIRIELNFRNPAKSRAVIGIRAPEEVRILRAELARRPKPEITQEEPPI